MLESNSKASLSSRFELKLLPSPCTAPFQALSINSFFGDVSETNDQETFSD